MESPKLFISYSWSDPTHEQWVVDLATQLRESGVDVILDKWDLKEGHDAYAFMEKMVTDSTILKVAIIADRTYAEKADGRSGGVGTETQIISKEVYEKQQQDKFVTIVTEKDESGRPYLPTYYKSRVYIDLSEPDRYAENFEKLLRWIYNKPLYKKPEMGKEPVFLSGDESISLGATASFKRVIDAIKNNKSIASGALDEYFEIFVQNLERFRIEKYDGEFDDAVIKNIEEFLPYRNESIQLFITIAQYVPNDDYIQKLYRFFERLIPYMHHPQNIGGWNERDFDNFKFIIHELFLYVIAVLLKFERFEPVAFLLNQQYYIPGNSDYGRDVMMPFRIFREYIQSLEDRNKRLNLKRLSLRADILKERSNATGIDFRYLMQADFVLFMKAALETNDDFDGWWPETLVYLGHYHSAFEIFARATSKKYFEKIKCLLAINSPDDLCDLLKSYQEKRRNLPRWEFTSFNPLGLLGYDQLAKRP